MSAVTEKLARRIAVLERIERHSTRDETTGCQLWLGAIQAAGGYGYIKVERKQRYVHRVVWEMARGPIPVGSYVCHSCDVPACCNLDHLFLGTPMDNHADMWAKGRQQVKGPMRAKLTAKEVETIRDRRRRGERVEQLSLEYGISPRQVYRVASGDSWRKT